MKRRLLSVFALAILFASCSSAYRQAQTPDDVYFSPAKEKERTYASANDSKQTDNYASRNKNNYDDYTSSSEDDYLRMKIQNRYRWGSLDDYDYWYSPSYAFNNYYGYNSFNPFLANSWGLSFYYSPFTSIQPYGWFNSYYPTYGYYMPYSGYYGHGYGYNYMPVFQTNVKRAPGVHRPLLGSYANMGNGGYNNSNNRSRNTGRYISPFNTGDSRYSNRNNSFSNDNSYSRPSSSNNNSAPVRSFTPSSSGSSSGGGGGVTRQPHH